MGKDDKIVAAVSFKLPVELVEAYKTIARSEYRSFTKQVELILEEELARRKAKEED